MSPSPTALARVVFLPSGKRGQFPEGTSLLSAARQLGVDLDSVCGGRGICGRCQINVAEGHFPKHGLESRHSHLTAWSEPEQRYKDRRGLAEDRRLACHTKLQGAVVVDIPPESQVHKQVVRKRAELRDIALDPAVRLCYVQVEPADMANPSGDFERLCQALDAQWGYSAEAIRADLPVLAQLQKALKQGVWMVTCALYADRQTEDAEIIGCWPGFRDRLYGVAVDVGSTTLSAHVTDYRTGNVIAAGGMMNPQIRFGEDLMSRVSYLMMNPDGLDDLVAAVREGLNGLFHDVTAEAGLSPDDILEMTVVGNPIMHHLLLGYDPTDLGGAPFALVHDRAITVRAHEIGLAINPHARIYALPLIAGHVGADAAAVALSETPYRNDEWTLIVDIGTNAEILLGNKDRLVACSSPTGPAFEGAQISAGQRAAPGAIERVRINPESLEPRYKIIGVDIWSDDPGFDAAAAEVGGVSGICGSGIIEVVAEMFLAGILSADGIIDGRKAALTPRIEARGRTFDYCLVAGETPVYITQADIRAIQLAKAALYAGARLLMDHLGIAQVERITLAGAFGSYIDVKYAMVLGLIPDCDLKNVAAAGNAAGTGARIALLNRQARREIEAVVHNIEKIETALEPKFQEHFVGAMAIPHKTAPYPHLAAAVPLPARDESDEPRDGSRSRRRRRR